jgi:transposase-like protein
MFNESFNSILELIQRFPDQQSCVDYFEELRWSGYTTSPFDPTSKIYKCKLGYKCRNTGKYFSVLTGTMFENTKVPLQKWFIALWLLSCQKKGISSIQLSRQIGVTQSTAWRMAHKIRERLSQEVELSGEVEVDETYVGGKNKNRHKNKRVKYSQGRSYKDKTPVFGMIERSGNLVAKVVKDVKGNTLKPIIYQGVKKGSIIHSDEWFAYTGLSRDFNHLIVHHGKGEYVKESAHTNNIECFWSHLKRGVVGVYHWVSKKHLQQYVDEFVFRYNTRNISGYERFSLLLQLTKN